MGTKNNPGAFDCYAKALPDEPIFILLARDPVFYKYVMKWANNRDLDMRCGYRSDSDAQVIHEARECAFQGQQWRKRNNGIWRKR